MTFLFPTLKKDFQLGLLFFTIEHGAKEMLHVLTTALRNRMEETMFFWTVQNRATLLLGKASGLDINNIDFLSFA